MTAGGFPRRAARADRWTAGDLRRAQTLGVGGILALVSGLLLWFSSSSFGDQAFESMRARGSSLARMLAMSREAALQSGNDQDLQPLLDRLAGDADLVYADIVDAEGTILAEVGATIRPSEEVLSARSPGAARGPAGPSDVVSGTQGERLYFFACPVRRRGAGASPSAAAETTRAPAGTLAPRPASAAPRLRGRTDTFEGEARIAMSPASVAAARRAATLKEGGFAALLVLGGLLLARNLSGRLVATPMAQLADVAGRFDEVVEEIRASADMVVAGTLNQQESLKKISASAETMTQAIRNVAGSVGSLSSSSDETSTSILAMVASIEEVAGHADGLTMSVNDTSATTQEMVASIKEIDRNVELLNQFVAETSGAMAQMGRAIQQVERNTADSKGISELVAHNAEKGMRAVELTIDGMESIRKSVAESSRAIESVGRRGQEIGLILNVIQEVTEQTNLLALNAAIIAAQAGEHGRGFAVVAEEIRQLAERTATSAKEIGTLISSFQAETGSAVAAMQEGSRRVEDGSERSREAGRALQEILESARRSSSMVGEIAAATREQALGSQGISSAVDKVRDMVSHIKQATAGQNLGSEQIMSAVENMREMAGHVKRATVEQAKGSRLITAMIEEITDLVGSIDRAASEQSAASERCVQVISGFASVTSANLASATRMQEGMEVLRERARGLREAVERFQDEG